MKRSISIAAASLCALASTSCVENDNVVMAIVANQATSRAGGCIVTNAEGAIRTEGLLDVAVTEGGYDGFILFPLIRNQLIERSAAIGSRDNITLMGVDIELIPDGAVAGALPSSARKFFAPGAGGTISPDKLGVMTIHAIPRAQALLLGAAVKDKVINPPVVMVKYRAVGTRAGDVIYSGWVEFPVRLCRNCLSGGEFGACPTGGFDATAIMATGCLPEQDDGNLCCTANNGSLFCPGAVKLSQ